jgi:hypothetical protein
MSKTKISQQASQRGHAYQFPCLTNATQPVRRFFQNTSYGAGEMQRATEEVRLNQRRVELQRRATGLAQEYTRLPSLNSAVPPCLESTTAPVRRFFQDVNYGSTEMNRALEEARLNQRRVALEREQANLAREYATYNADVSAHYRYNAPRNNASLYLHPDPASANSECWVPPSVPATPSSLPRSPSSSGPLERLPAVQGRPWNNGNAQDSQRYRAQQPPLQYDDGVSPAFQQREYRQPPTYRELPVCPPLPPEPTQVLPSLQPGRAYNSMPRGEDTILYQGRLYAPLY